MRVDTCGENLAQGAIARADSPEAEHLRKLGLPFSHGNHPDAKYWYGNGVTISGVYALRQALDQAGFGSVRIVLSSGFADVAKVKAFVAAEKALGVRLFDSLGVGGVFQSRAAKTDIVRAGTSSEDWQPIAKAGRGERPNSRAVLVTDERLQRLAVALKSAQTRH